MTAPRAIVLWGEDPFLLRQAAAEILADIGAAAGEWQPEIWKLAEW